MDCRVKPGNDDRALSAGKPVIFGTDSPMLLALKQKGIDVITELGLDDASEEMIFSGTARKLLKL